METTLGLLAIFILYIIGGIIIFKLASIVGSKLFRFFRKLFRKSGDK